MTVCDLCGDPVQPGAYQTLQRVQGWERRALSTSSRRGGSDILLRERQNVYAHGRCVDRARDGLAPTQDELAL